MPSDSPADSATPPRKKRRFSARDRHDRNAGTPPAPVRIDHPLVCQDAPILIERQTDFDEALNHCRLTGRFTYDSEFIGEESYFPRLCLVQLATHERLFIVDALAGLDLSPLWNLLADDAVLKIVHAGRSDLEPVQRHLNRPPARIFDTQLAAGFAALPYPLSLQKLAEHLLGIRLGKGLTFTRWDRRPLREDQIFYAADDVRLGLAMHAGLEARLNQFGHLPWAQACCEELCGDISRPVSVQTMADRVRGARLLKQPVTRAVLRELAQWRDRAAQAADLPPRTFCPDGLLLALAERRPRDQAGLGKIDHLPRPLREHHADAILEAVERGRQNPAPQSDSAEPAAAKQRFELEKAWAAIQHHCFQLGIDPGLLTSRREVVDWFARRQTGGHALQSGWRGDILAAVLKNF